MIVVIVSVVNVIVVTVVVIVVKNRDAVCWSESFGMTKETSSRVACLKRVKKTTFRQTSVSRQTNKSLLNGIYR